jgi:ribosomal small subunit protein bTHX
MKQYIENNFFYLYLWIVNFYKQLKLQHQMGRGDIKSKKGKIANGSYGKKRKQRTAKKIAIVAKPVKTKKVSVEEAGEPEVKKTKKTTKKTVKKTVKKTTEETNEQ